MNKLSCAFLLAVSLLVIYPNAAFSHCQIPCGIYDDHARVKTMLEDAETIRKSVALMAELSAKTDPQSKNQLVRWVMNKEQHAQNIIETISSYFLTQRVKPKQKGYEEKLAKHHAVILAAMSAKQNSSVKNVDSLQKSIEALLPYYPVHKH